MSDSTIVTAPLSRLPQTLAQLYQDRYAMWTAKLAKIEAQLEMLMASPVESYSFSGGEGQQQAKRRALPEVMEAATHAEKMVGYYWKKLHGYGNVNLALRRR